jgi:hypothetical protein
MEIPVFAIVYATVFIAAEMIWLITVRNRNIILVSCATILVGVQGLSLILGRPGFKMGPQFSIQYTLKLFLIDVFILLAIWLLFNVKPQFKVNGERSLNPFSLLTGFLLYPLSIAEAFISSRWFKPILFLLIIFWCINNVCKSCSTWPDG